MSQIAKQRFERVTDRTRKVFATARVEALKYNHHEVGPDALLAGLLTVEGSEENSIVAAAFRSVGLTLPRVQSSIRFGSGNHGEERTADDLAIAPALEKVIERARNIVEARSSPCMCPEHLLLALLKNWENEAVRILAALRVSARDLELNVSKLLDVCSGHPRTMKEFTGPPEVLGGAISRHLLDLSSAGVEKVTVQVIPL